MRDYVGRASIENDQPLLLQTIADIVLFGNAADDRRQTEFIRSATSLNHLT